jgi:hypothetical protein
VDPEEQAKYDGFMNEIEDARAAIKREEQLRAVEADAFFKNASDEARARAPSAATPSRSTPWRPSPCTCATATT